MARLRVEYEGFDNIDSEPNASTIRNFNDRLTALVADHDVDITVRRGISPTPAKRHSVECPQYDGVHDDLSDDSGDEFDPYEYHPDEVGDDGCYCAPRKKDTTFNMFCKLLGVATLYYYWKGTW